MAYKILPPPLALLFGTMSLAFYSRRSTKDAPENIDVVLTLGTLPHCDGRKLLMFITELDIRCPISG